MQMNDNERDLYYLFVNASDEGRKFIMDAIWCVANLGESFKAEIRELVARGDGEGIKKAVARGMQG